MTLRLAPLLAAALLVLPTAATALDAAAPVPASAPHLAATLPAAPAPPHPGPGPDVAAPPPLALPPGLAPGLPPGVPPGIAAAPPPPALPDIPWLVDERGDTMTGPLVMDAELVLNESRRLRFPAGMLGADADQPLAFNGAAVCLAGGAHPGCGDVAAVRAGPGLAGGAEAGVATLEVLAGPGLEADEAGLRVAFAGPGTLDLAARADHDHGPAYVRSLGGALPGADGGIGVVAGPHVAISVVDIPGDPGGDAEGCTGCLLLAGDGVAEALDCLDCVGPEHLEVPYAASATEGGPAADLACVACVGPAELDFVPYPGIFAGPGLRADPLPGGGHVVGIAHGGLTGDDVADGSLAGADLATGAITGAHVADGSLSGADLAPGSVTGAQVAAATLAGTHLATGAVGGAHVAAGAIAGDHVAPGAIAGDHVADGTLTGADLADGTIGARHLAFVPGTLTGLVAGAGLVGGGASGEVTLAVAAGGVAGDMLADDAVTAAKVRDEPGLSPGARGGQATLGATPLRVASATARFPAPGHAFVLAYASLEQGSPAAPRVSAQLRDGAGAALDTWVWDPGDDDGVLDHRVGHATAVAVGAGPHTFELFLSTTIGTAEAGVGQVFVLYFPTQY